MADLSGQRYNRLLVQHLSHREGSGRKVRLIWNCVCDCGKQCFIRGDLLRSKNTQSCGCLLADTASARHITHGMSKTRTYRIWQHMHARCRDPKNKHFHRYGGRGIAVCDRGEIFENFLADMGEAPPKLEIDRIDNEGAYAPNNCRWATRREQCMNTSRSVRLEYKGETLSEYAWAERVGVTRTALRSRRRAGWSIERMLETPHD